MIQTEISADADVAHTAEAVAEAPFSETEIKVALDVENSLTGMPSPRFYSNAPA